MGAMKNVFCKLCRSANHAYLQIVLVLSVKYLIYVGLNSNSKIMKEFLNKLIKFKEAADLYYLSSVYPSA